MSGLWQHGQKQVGLEKDGSRPITFGVVCKAVERNSYPTSLFKRLLGLGQFDLSKVMSVQWGTDHEDEAAHFYATRMAQFEVDSVEECGL